MRDHRQARLDLVEHVADGVVRGVSLVDRRVHDDGRHAEFQRLEVGRVRLHFGDEHVHALGQFQREFVGPPVAGPDERQPIPVEPVGRGAVLGVRPPPVADGHAVLVVADAVVVAEIELVDLDLVAVADRGGVEGVRVPMGHHLHAIDQVLDAVLRRPARWPMHAQRLPASHPRREGE